MYKLYSTFIKGILLFLISVYVITCSKAPSVAQNISILDSIRPTTVQQLKRSFDRYDYSLSDIKKGRFIVVETLPNNFNEIQSVSKKKRLFRNIILPLTLLENYKLGHYKKKFNRISSRVSKSDTVMYTHLKQKLSSENMDFLFHLIDNFKLLKEDNEVNVTVSSLSKKIQRRIHRIPPSIVLGQAAIESGWGTSRFAREANNLFGERTYNKSTSGLRPKSVSDTASFKVRSFASLQDSVRSYMHTLNTHWAYKKFRNRRIKYGTSNPVKLIQGLSRYSIRRENYLTTLTNLIRHNKFARFDEL